MTRHFATIVLLIALALSAAAIGQVNDLRLPVIIDADRTDYDGKTSMLKFTGLRLTQGSIGIQADIAHASRMDFDDSIWHFEGNVVFDVNEGHITCETADLKFSDFQLLEASISGSPATFRFQRAGSEESTYAEAGTLIYNVANGIIEFSGGATITEGGNRISSESLVYNVRERQINASGNGVERVKVVYTPEESDAGGVQESLPDPETDDARPESNGGAGPEATDDPPGDGGQ